MTKAFIRSESGVLGRIEANCAATGRTMDLIVALAPGGAAARGWQFPPNSRQGFRHCKSLQSFQSLIGQITSVRELDEWRRMRHLTLNEGIITQYNSQHRQILNAIRTREPARAANLMKEHLETARLSLTRAAAT